MNPGSLSARSAPLYLIAGLCLAMSLAGCQQLFTFSLAGGLARDSIPLPAHLSAADAAELAAQAKANGDETLATALVENLVGVIGATPTAGQTGLAASAAEAAVVASGTSSILMDILSGGTVPTDPASLTTLMDGIRAGGTTDIVTALTYLADPAVLADPAASGLNATDLLIAAAVIAASATPPGSDPSTLDYSTMLPADQDKIDNAILILTAATALPGLDATTQSLLNDIIANMPN
jgi:hypothetical protein